MLYALTYLAVAVFVVAVAVRVIVLFRIAENTGVLADHLRENTPSD